MKQHLPVIEGRTAEDFKKEAIRRIKKYYPQWDIEDPSDLGHILTEIFSWFAEMIAYKVNQVPEKMYENFIKMLGIKPAPARPARTVVYFEFHDDKKRAIDSSENLQQLEFQYKGMKYILEDKNLIYGIQPEKVYKIVEKKDNYFLYKNESELPSLNFTPKPILLNQIYFRISDNILKNIKLPIEVTMEIPYDVHNLESKLILEQFFKNGDYFLYDLEGKKKIKIEKKEVHLDSSKIEIKIPGGQSNFDHSNGKLEIIKSFPLAQLKNLNIELGKPSLKWSNSLNPFPIEKLLYVESDDPKYYDFSNNSPLFKNKNTQLLLELSLLKYFPDSTLYFMFEIENSNKVDALFTIDAYYMVDDHKIELTRVENEEQFKKNVKNVWFDETNSFHKSGKIMFKIETLPNGTVHEEISGIHVILENNKESIVKKAWKINKAFLVLEGEKTDIQQYECFFGKNYVVAAGENKKICAKSNHYSLFTSGLLLVIPSCYKELLKKEFAIFIRYTKSLEEKINPGRFKFYTIQNNGWYYVPIKNIELMDYRGLFITLKLSHTEEFSLYNDNAIFLLIKMPNEYMNFVSDIYFNVSRASQIEHKKSLYLGKNINSMYQSFEVPHGYITNCNAIKIEQAGKEIHTFFSNENKFSLDYSENSIQLHGEEFVQLHNVEIFACDVSLTEGEKGNIEENKLTIMNSIPSSIKKATNIIPGFGGKNPEKINDIKENVPKLFFTNDKAVTIDDFEKLVRNEFPQVNRVKALYNFKSKYVEIYVLPEQHLANKDDFLLLRIQQFLEEKTMINMHVRVMPVKLKRIGINAVVALSPDSRDEEIVLVECEKLIKAHIHPYLSEPKKNTWEFGKPVVDKYINGLLFQIPDIAYVHSLELLDLSNNGNIPDDRIPIQSFELPFIEVLNIEFVTL